jgi:hypothetical protein
LVTATIVADAVIVPMVRPSHALSICPRPYVMLSIYVSDTYRVSRSVVFAAFQLDVHSRSGKRLRRQELIGGFTDWGLGDPVPIGRRVSRTSVAK